MLIGQHLNFYMARRIDQFLQIKRRIAERRLRFGARHRHRFRQFLLALDLLHAASAAAGYSLHQNRIANRFGGGGEFCDIPQRARRTRNHRHAQFLHSLLGLHFIAHHADMRRRRADKGEARLLDDTGEIGVFREKAVAGMNGIGVGDFGSRDDGGNIEITITYRGRPDTNRFIRDARMHSVGIGNGMHRDGLDAQFPARAVNAHRDFAAIGYENFVEHEGGQAERGRRPVLFQHQ